MVEKRRASARLREPSAKKRAEAQAEESRVQSSPTSKPAPRVSKPPAPPPASSTPPPPPPPPPPLLSPPPPSRVAVLPSRLIESNPLPTLKEPQPLDLPDEKWHGVTESAVFTTSLHQSRQRWLHEGILEKYWSKSTNRKRKEPPEGEKAKKDSRPPMTRIGPCTVTIEPHIFEATLYTVKGPPVQSHGNSATQMPIQGEQNPTPTTSSTSTTSQKSAQKQQSTPENNVVELKINGNPTSTGPSTIENGAQGSTLTPEQPSQSAHPPDPSNSRRSEPQDMATAPSARLPTIDTSVKAIKPEPQQDSQFTAPQALAAPRKPSATPSQPIATTSKDSFPMKFTGSGTTIVSNKPQSASFVSLSGSTINNTPRRPPPSVSAPSAPSPSVPTPSAPSQSVPSQSVPQKLVPVQTLASSGQGPPTPASSNPPAKVSLNATTSSNPLSKPPAKTKSQPGSQSGVMSTPAKVQAKPSVAKSSSSSSAVNPSSNQQGAAKPAASSQNIATDPVIHMLAHRASTDNALKQVMKIVASGNASPAQLEYFQKHIDELTQIVRERQEEEARKKASAAAVTASPAQPRPAALGPPTQMPTTPSRPATLSKPAPVPASSAKPPANNSSASHDPHHNTLNPSSLPAPIPSNPLTPATHIQPAQLIHTPPPVVRARPVPIPQHVLIEFAGNPVDRFLFPRQSIVQFLNGGNTAIVSFLVVRKLSDSAENAIRKDEKKAKKAENKAEVKTQEKATEKDNITEADQEKDMRKSDEFMLQTVSNEKKIEAVNDAKSQERDVFQPVTIRFDAPQASILANFGLVAAPADEVKKHMLEVATRCERADAVWLPMRLPKERKAT